jgi:hypothetical protein
MVTIVVALDSVTLEHCRYRCSECLIFAVQVQVVLYSTLAELSRTTPLSVRVDVCVARANIAVNSMISVCRHKHLQTIWRGESVTMKATVSECPY